ncbi:hypothetical protein NT07LI_2930 [Listeria innocua FSL S4-378]|nr:hypothetical protein NT07LI_2930 [Listeria innocua FSL S4-378]
MMILPNTFKRNPTTKPNFHLLATIFDFFVTFKTYSLSKLFSLFFLIFILYSLLDNA